MSLIRFADMPINTCAGSDLPASFFSYRHFAQPPGHKPNQNSPDVQLRTLIKNGYKKTGAAALLRPFLPTVFLLASLFPAF
jgi:hypothetical protein